MIKELIDFFEGQIQGGSIQDFTSLIDEAIDTGIITKGYFDQNEIAIAIWFDNNWFTCNTCSWTLPIEEMADNDEWECFDCENP